MPAYPPPPSMTLGALASPADELVQAGWEKCWSKRENRPYYFNRFTNQSLWEMPLLGQHDVISDPLGLNAAPAPADGGAAEVATVESRLWKRKLSEEGQPSGNLAKKPKVEVPGNPAAQPAPNTSSTPGTPLLKAWGVSPEERQAALLRPTEVYWDLDIQTNAVIKQRAPSEVLSPHPEVELLRSQLMLKLRQHYRELCQQREGIDPPRESFNRWMLERKVVDKGSDPLLPSNCEPVVSPSMFREIMNDIPIRLSRIKFREEAKRLLFKYAEAAKRLIESSWLRRDRSASKEDYMDRLEHLRKQCGSLGKDSVEGICSKIYHISLEYVKRIREKHLALLKEHSIPAEVEPPDVQDRLVYCYPVRLAVPPCLDFFPISGSFQANPPFCEELMDAMVTHFEKLLEASGEPLSFIVFIPEWRDPPPTALTRMEQSPFKRQQLVLPAFDHEYRSGSQHLCKKEEMYYKAVHNTTVLFLQNNAGFSKWEPSQERLQELLSAYKHSGRAQPATPAAPPAPDKDPEPVREQSTSREPTPN
ncbi:putative Phosphorylated CTD-interacting factor 1-like protein [Naja naja]|nr:putative Phosphorylated CTD-interacting factor 1-like protein [Naja naja]